MVKKFIVIIYIILTIACSGCDTNVPSSANLETSKLDTYEINMKRDILSLMIGYPGYIAKIERSGEKVYIIMNSGRKILYDDKKQKSTDEKLNNPDIQDMMEQIYPLEPIKKLMDNDFDPGRIRIYPIMQEVYGDTKENICKNLKGIRVGGGSFLFNSCNRAADELNAVINELNILAKSGHTINKFLYPANGTFNYRYISGTSRLSAHAFGTAIDLASDKRDYWKWAAREQGQKRLSEYSAEVVKAFEDHNFIWGGKWGHFDIFHFEYRPEIVIKSRYLNSELQAGDAWYTGIDTSDERLIEYIDFINEAIDCIN